MCEGYLISDLAEGDHVGIVGGEYQGQTGRILHVTVNAFLIRLDRSGKVAFVYGAWNLFPVPDEPCRE